MQKLIKISVLVALFFLFSYLALIEGDNTLAYGTISVALLVLIVSYTFTHDNQEHDKNTESFSVISKDVSTTPYKQPSEDHQKQLVTFDFSTTRNTRK